jgi:hypothetical protein
MATNKSHDQQRSDDCRQTTRRILEAVAYSLHDREEKWLSADKKHDVEVPGIRLRRYFGTFSDIEKDLRRYNFYKCMSWLEQSLPNVAAKVHTKMDLLAKALNENQFQWEPDLDASTLDPLARRLSEVGDFLRQVANTLDANQPEAPPAAKMDQGEGTSKRFRVALSFPGEHRKFVEAVATSLTDYIHKDRIFYDKYYEAELARLNLDTYLQQIYHDDSELIVVFLCAEYESKDWCGLEWRAIRDLLKQKQTSQIMPFRFDNISIPGVFSIDGYVEVGNRSASEIASLILKRLETNDQQNPL